MEFRNLKNTEIQVRPTDTKTRGSATLLLYQDARCGMDILDESIGPENWQREYYEVKGNIYCRIGIKVGDEWIWKSDCGTESNIDAVKGEASDAFKRACVCWGIGRELYSGPRIKIVCPDDYYYNDHLTMTFRVKEIAYEGKKITSLTIVDRKGNEVFKYGDNKVVPVFQPKEERKSFKDILNEFCDAQPKSGEIERFRGYYLNKLATTGWTGPFQIENIWNSWTARAAR